MTAKKITDFADGGAFQAGDSVLIARGVDNFHVNGGIIANAVATLSSLTARLATLESSVGGATSFVSATYWRLRIIENFGGSTAEVGELQLRSTVGGPSIATGGTAFADSIYGAGYEAALAFDGNLNTQWSSLVASSSRFIGYQFPSAVTIKEIAVTRPAEGGQYAPKTAILESSNDGTTYQSIGIINFTSFDTTTTQTYTVPGSVVAAPVVTNGNGGGETILASCILYIDDNNGTIDTTKTKKNNIGTITRTAAGKWHFNFTKPLPNLDVHISASCQYSAFDDDWHTYPVFPRKAADRLTTSGISIWTPQQNGVFYDPAKLEFKITAFTPEVVTPEVVTPEVVTPVTSTISADRWRLLFPEGSAGAGNSYLRIAGVEFRKAVGVAEAHSEGVVLGTSGANEPLANAFDGNSSTYWDAGYETATNSNIGFGFNSTRVVKEVAITASNVAIYAPKSFKLQYLDPGLNWVDAFTSTSPLSWSSGETKVFTI